jgi:hypothetical protein
LQGESGIPGGMVAEFLPEFFGVLLMSGSHG